MAEQRAELQLQVDELKRLRKLIGLNRKQFSERMEIPLRTLEEWEAGRRKMPEYLLRTLSYYIRMNKYLEEKGLKEEVEEELYNEKERDRDIRDRGQECIIIGNDG